MFLDLGEVALCRRCPLRPSNALPSRHPRASDPGRVASDLCLQTKFHRLRDCSFLASAVCSLLSEAGLETCAGLLVGRPSACPLVGGAGSWASGGQSHVKGCV